MKEEHVYHNIWISLCPMKVKWSIDNPLLKIWKSASEFIGAVSGTGKFRESRGATCSACRSLPCPPQEKPWERPICEHTWSLQVEESRNGDNSSPVNCSTSSFNSSSFFSMWQSLYTRYDLEFLTASSPLLSYHGWRCGRMGWRHVSTASRVQEEGESIKPARNKSHNLKNAFNTASLTSI